MILKSTLKGVLLENLARLGLTGEQRWMLMVCFRMQEFHESLHSLLLWLDHAERRRPAVSVGQPDTSPSALQEHRDTLRVGTQSLSAGAPASGTREPSRRSTGSVGGAAAAAGSAHLPPAAVVPAPA